MRLAAFPAVWAAPTGAGQRAHGLAKTTAAGYANRSLSAPIRDTLQRQLAPGCSKKSSAAAETAHAPAEGMTRPGFCSRHCRVTREYVSNDATARLGSGHCPPARCPPLAGSWFCAHAADLRSAGCALSSVCNTAATHAILLRLTHKRGLGAATRRHPFLSRKGCKSDPRGHPLDIPLMGLAAFPAVWAAIFLPIPGANTTGFPRDVPKNRRLPPKPPTLLRRARRAPILVRNTAASHAALAGSRSRPESRLRHCSRHTRFCYPLRHSAIWPRRLAAPSGGQNAPMA